MQRPVQAPLREAGTKIAGHGEGADRGADLPRQAEDGRGDRCRGNREHEAADRLRRAENRMPVEEFHPAVERKSEAFAQDLLGHHRRAVGDGEEDEELEDEERVHAGILLEFR